MEEANQQGSRAALTVRWREAPQRVRALAQAWSERTRGAVVVGITGAVGSGKSTLAARLGACVVSTDWYLPDYEAIPREKRDDPDVSDYARLAQDVAELRSGRGVWAPVWSFQTHRREGVQRVEAGEIIVCEGIHALHGPAAKLVDIAVYVEAPVEVRWERWAHLERTGQRGWGVEYAKDYFERVAEPTFVRHAAQYRAAADLIVLNDAGIPS